ncbi:MAG: tetraacyldisaccharide 4'-kinase [Planctomycetaceae bacterium]|nr:tetraacyldisaccharide 4'-kinase [Planctomycetaceae bacterium]
MLSPAQFRDLVSGRWTGLWPSCLRGLLAAAERVYAAIASAKNRRFDSGRQQAVRVSAPVISVGNLTVGGTGKTPLVAWLAEWFQSRGRRVAIISRGYGAQGGGPNDEALELAARLPVVPHLQNPDRVAAAQQAIAAHPRHVLILDDAFQHRRIARDLDIVLLDALEPFGHERLLPRGLLREPVASLARAHVVALSRADAVDEAARVRIRERVRQVAPRAVWVELEHRPTYLVNHTGQRIALGALCGQSVAAFCGIGNPAGFEHTLRHCELDVVAFRALDDHFAYPPDELARLASWVSENNPAAVICTRKDLVKIPHDTLGGRPLWALAIELAITAGQAELEERLAPIAEQCWDDG